MNKQSNGTSDNRTSESQVKNSTLCCQKTDYIDSENIKRQIYKQYHAKNLISTGHYFPKQVGLPGYWKGDSFSDNFEQRELNLIFKKGRTFKTPSLYKTFISKHILDLKNGQNLGSTPLNAPKITAMKKNATNQAPRKVHTLEKSSHWFNCTKKSIWR